MAAGTNLGSCMISQQRPYHTHHPHLTIPLAIRHVAPLLSRHKHTIDLPLSNPLTGVGQTDADEMKWMDITLSVGSMSLCAAESSVCAVYRFMSAILSLDPPCPYLEGTAYWCSAHHCCHVRISCYCEGLYHTEVCLFFFAPKAIRSSSMFCFLPTAVLCACTCGGEKEKPIQLTDWPLLNGVPVITTLHTDSGAAVLCAGAEFTALK